MGKKDHRISIIADDRERNAQVIQFFSEMPNVSVNVERLVLGDYLVDDRLLFERKALNDFALSLIDGRLFRQMTRLAGSKHKGVLILEGTGKDIAKVGVRREALQGALITVSLVLGIPILRSQSPSESAHLILYAAKQVNYLTGGGIPRHGSRPRGKRKRQLFILQGFPGVGPERAARLLEKFGSVQAIVTASFEELQAVEGIGKHIAEKITWAVNESMQTYGSSGDFTS
jgi:DNA excision repair protein ERCC-4